MFALAHEEWVKMALKGEKNFSSVLHKSSWILPDVCERNESRRREQYEWMESNVQEFNQIFTRSDF